MIRRGWYLPRLTSSPPREVLRVGPGQSISDQENGISQVPRRTYVYYGTGGGRHRSCLEKTFNNWIRTTAAKRGKGERKCLELGMTPSGPVPQ